MNGIVIKAFLDAVASITNHFQSPVLVRGLEGRARCFKTGVVPFQRKRQTYLEIKCSTEKITSSPIGAWKAQASFVRFRQR